MLEKGPNPIVQFAGSSRLLIIGQAPGAKVHESGVPWRDASGDRLRDWTGLGVGDFYNPGKVALVPMGFCYPGKGSHGDLPPRPECAPQWHDRVFDLLHNKRLVLLVGSYAQARYLTRPGGKQSLTDAVRNFRAYGPSIFPLPHPSWRSGIWMKRNPWFEAEVLPPLRSVIDQWTRRHPDRSVAIVLDEIDTILRTERRAYLLGEWREASALGQALATLLPTGSPVVTKAQVAALRSALHQTGFPRDVIEGVLEGLQMPPDQRRQSPLLEELRSASALVLAGGAVCRVILAGHAELVEARWDLFGPLLNFAKLRMLGPLDETSAERMVREPFTRLGLRFESAAVEQVLLEKTFRVPAWLQHCGALIIQSIDERLRSSRREEQKITERDVVLALEKVHAEERTALQSENGLYMLGPECSFVLLCLVDEPWFTIDSAVDYLHVLFYQTLDVKDRQKIARRDEDFYAAFSSEVVRRIVRDLTNTFYLTSDEAQYLTTEGRPSYSSPGFNVPALAPSATSPGAVNISHGGGSPSSPGILRPQDRDRLRRSYKVSRSIVSTVFHDELSGQKRIELARRAMRLWQEGRGVWARTANKAYT